MATVINTVSTVCRQLEGVQYCAACAGEDIGDGGRAGGH